jgi:uncharacterized protein
MKDFKIRAVTAFVHLSSADFDQVGKLELKIEQTVQSLLKILSFLKAAGYVVQTYRIATNPFGEYLPDAKESDKLKSWLSRLDGVLEAHNLQFFAMGNAVTEDDIKCIPYIISTSHRFSCSAEIKSGRDISMAKAAAECIRKISLLGETGEFKNMDHVALCHVANHLCHSFRQLNLARRIGGSFHLQLVLKMESWPINF